jgi:hypothetical protein
VKDLTPKIGPHPHDIAAWRRSAERYAGTRPNAVLTHEVNRLRHQLEHLGGLPDRVDALAELTETGTGGGARRGSNRYPAWPPLSAVPQITCQLNELAVGPPIVRASRR